MTLLEETKLLLDKAPRTFSLAHIAREAKLEPAWLTAFARGKIADPGVKKIQSLHDVLAKLVS